MTGIELSLTKCFPADYRMLLQRLVKMVTSDQLISAANWEKQIIGDSRPGIPKGEVESYLGNIGGSSTPLTFPKSCLGDLRLFARMAKTIGAEQPTRLFAAALTLHSSTYNLSDFVESLLVVRPALFCDGVSYLLWIIDNAPRISFQVQEYVAALGVLFGGAMAELLAESKELQKTSRIRMADHLRIPHHQLEPGNEPVLGVWSDGWRAIVANIRSSVIENIPEDNIR